MDKMLVKYIVEEAEREMRTIYMDIDDLIGKKYKCECGGSISAKNDFQKRGTNNDGYAIYEMMKCDKCEKLYHINIESKKSYISSHFPVN